MNVDNIQETGHGAQGSCSVCTKSGYNNSMVSCIVTGNTFQCLWIWDIKSRVTDWWIEVCKNEIFDHIIFSK